jgi:NDP-sugar pyrophosphorylase family protein
VDISIVHEKKLQGTAQTLKNLSDNLCTEDFSVMHGDNYFEDDLTNLCRAHSLTKINTLATVGTIRIEDPSMFGTFVLSNQGEVVKFYEKIKNSPSLIANTAIYVMKPEIKEIIKNLKIEETDISLHLLPKLIGNLKAEPLKGYFFDIGTPTNLKLANNIK